MYRCYRQVCIYNLTLTTAHLQLKSLQEGQLTWNIIHTKKRVVYHLKSIFPPLAKRKSNICRFFKLVKLTDVSLEHQQHFIRIYGKNTILNSIITINLQTYIVYVGNILIDATHYCNFYFIVGMSCQSVLLVYV